MGWRTEIVAVASGSGVGRGRLRGRARVVSGLMAGYWTGLTDYREDFYDGFVRS